MSADVVFHAAAMKQVPTCEYFPAQAAATNVSARTTWCARCAAPDKPAHARGMSTDKACKPINVMGMTKALQERIIIEGNLPLESGGCRMFASATATCSSRVAP